MSSGEFTVGVPVNGYRCSTAWANFKMLWFIGNIPVLSLLSFCLFVNLCKTPLLFFKTCASSSINVFGFHFNMSLREILTLLYVETNIFVFFIMPPYKFVLLILTNLLFLYPLSVTFPGAAI